MAAAGIGTRTGVGRARARASATTSIALSLETMEILRKAGADVNARITDVTSLTARIARTNTMTGRQGQTTLFYVAEIGRTAVVKYLLDHGAKADVMDDMGRTPIDLVEGARGRPRRQPVEGNCRAAAEGHHDTTDPLTNCVASARRESAECPACR